MIHWKSLASGLLLIGSFPLLTFALSDASTPVAVKKQVNRKEHASNPQTNGERKFAQNCGRCHTSPEGFPPQISGTILRHMRVRASLSKQDEADILHFLNP